MSSWYVLSAAGIYSVCPGTDQYVIGSRACNKITITLENGRHFTVIAKNCSVVNKYIQSAGFNGKTLNTPWFTHEQLINGGTLELQMGPKPNKSWGTGEQRDKQ